MNWPEYVSRDTLAVMDGAVRPMTARQIADAILQGYDPNHEFYAKFRRNLHGSSDMHLIRRVKEILKTYATYPNNNTRLKKVGRIADGITYKNA